MRSFAATLTNSTVSGNSTEGDRSYGGGIIGVELTLTNSTVSGNSTAGQLARGGGIIGQKVTLTDSTVSGNNTAGTEAGGGGIYGFEVTLTNSTLSGNSTAGLGASGGGILSSIAVTLTSSTVTGNSTTGAFSPGAGIGARFGTIVANSIVAGNATGVGQVPDFSGAVSFSNGHNIFGSDVQGAVIGDFQGVAPSLLFASIDATGGGQLNAAGTVPLRNSITNPAVSGGDPMAALPTDQIGTTRPRRPAACLTSVPPSATRRSRPQPRLTTTC